MLDFIYRLVYIGLNTNKQTKGDGNMNNQTNQITETGETAMKAVLVTTAHRGVFAGLIDEDQDISATDMPLTQARMAIKFGTTRGVMELADTGPTEQSKISAVADIPMLHDITAIFAITDKAWAKWTA
jgi:hypothetical protein